MTYIHTYGILELKLREFSPLTLTPLAILAKNLPETAKIQHHAVTLSPNCWTWLELGHPAPCKVSLSGLYSTESIKIQQTQLLEFEWFGEVRVKLEENK